MRQSGAAEAYTPSILWQVKAETGTIDATHVDATPPAGGVVLVWSPAGPTCRPIGVDGSLILGRGVIQGVEIRDGRISRRHCRVERLEGRWRVTELGSRNGTFIDGRRVEGSETVDRLRLLRMGRCIFIPTDDVTSYEVAISIESGHSMGPRLHSSWGLLSRLARFCDTLALLGEPGSGRASAARHFHAVGPRAGGPLVEVHCDSVTDDNFDRIFFGGSVDRNSGRRNSSEALGALHTAEGGSLLLRGIEELPLSLQRRLLRALERQTPSVGLDGDNQRTGLGIIVSAEYDIRVLAGEGLFLEELYYRIGRPQVVIPALRERPEEIPELIVQTALAQTPRAKVHSSLIETCMLREWPGNIRELKTEVTLATQRALAAGRTVVRADDLDDQAGINLVRRNSEPSESSKRRWLSRRAKLRLSNKASERVNEVNGEHQRTPRAEESTLNPSCIRILFFAANPASTARLDIGSEFRMIDDAVASAQEAGRARLQAVWAAKPEDIQEHLLKFRPSVVHFSGHGGIPASGEAPGIILRGEYDDAIELSPKALASLFSICRGDTRCVLLNACYSQAQAELIASSVDCVIGTSESITDESAKIFCRSFYTALTHGESILTAFKLGQNAVELNRLADAGILRLIVRDGADATKIRFSAAQDA